MMGNNRQKVPGLLFVILKLLLSENDRDHLCCNYELYYVDIVKEKGRKYAWFWLLTQIVKSAPGLIYLKFYWSMSMLMNYFKIAYRNICLKKFYSLVNILDLALGLACFILILLYVNFEMSFDKYHANAENIYRVVIKHGGSFMGTDKWVWTPAPLAPTLNDNIPEVTRATRIEDFRDAALKYGEKNFTEDRFYLADPEVLHMFSYEFSGGNPETALDDPFSLIITEAMAAKYFGGKNPIGETVRLNDLYDFTITGTIKNIPENSHLKFDFLASFKSLHTIYGEKSMSGWNNSNYVTYVELVNNPNVAEIEKKFYECVSMYSQRGLGEYILQPVTDIHLSGTFPGEMDKNSEKKYIYIYLVIAVLILAIASFNYMNLATARSAKRAMDVGIRKIVGASRKQLINQFMGESLVFSFAALFLALVLAYLLLPLFNLIISRNLQFTVFSDSTIVSSLIGITVLIGLVSGTYPAVYISSYQPVRIIKGDHTTGIRGSLVFRNTLVIIQFIISIALVVSTLIVFQQLNYIRTIDAGFEREHIITMKVNRNNKGFLKNYEVFKKELQSSAGVVSVSASNWPPTNIRAGDMPAWEGKDEDNRPLFHNLLTDYDFIDLYGIELIQGRNFSEEISTDLNEAFIINETAAKIIGAENPVGMKFGYSYRPGKIIGVVRDFHFIPMTLKIIPLAIRVDLKRKQWVSIRMNTNDLKTTLTSIENTWKKFSPAFPFDYSFIDERFDALYKEENRQGASFGYFTFIAIFLACLGLFGLVTFTAEQKTREISIRKVFGASANNVTIGIVKEFVKWILLSSLVAVPVSWYAMNKWISNYAYRVDIGVGTYITGVVLVLIIALISVCYKAVKAAHTNPIDGLRYE